MHKRRFVFAFVCAGLLAVSGVVRASQSVRPGPPGNSEGPVTIAGKVTDSRGGPVEGAKVTLYQMIYAEGASSPNPQVVDEKSTGADGAFTVVIPQGVDPKKATYIVARKEGLALGWILWRMQGKQRPDIALGEAKDLAGEVVDEKGRPVAEAEVRISAAMMGKPEDRRPLVSPGFLCARTDGNGRFLFAAMPVEATFEFSVEKPGRATIGTLDRTTYRGGKYQFAPGQTGIKLTLPLEARIEGIVMEEASGRPAAGVMVMALPDSRLSMLLSPKTVTTTQDGTFRIGTLRAGTYIVQLPTSPEKMAEWVAEPVRVSLKAGETASGIKLELAKGSIIEVLVKDNAGKPVERASVNIRGVQDRQTFNGRTDENGLARVRVTPGEYLLSGVYGQGSGPQRAIRQPEQITVAEGETKRIEHVLSSAPKLAGIVRDEAGNPLAGVKFDVVPMVMARDEITSDAAGKFEVAWGLPMIGSPGTTFILVARDVAHNLAEAVDLDEQGGTLDLKLKPGIIVTGTVLGPEGQPLPGARIRVSMRGSRWVAPLGRSDLATAGPDGKFEIRALPPERQCTVSAAADGYGRREVPIDPEGVKDNRFEAGQFKLTRADLSITGVVVDPNDKPVADATIYGYGDGQPDPRMIQTDAEGKFTIQGVCPGTIRLQANSRGPTPMFGMAQAEGGATDLRIVISSRPTGASYMPRRPTSLKGKPLPPLKDLGIDLPADAEGQMLLVCFWDMGQRPSRYCLTQLAAQADPLREKGVRIVAVHAGEVEESALRQWIEKNKIPLPSGTISGDIDKTKSAWGVSSLPHLILTDNKKHTVVAEGVGWDDLDKQIEAAGR